MSTDLATTTTLETTPCSRCGGSGQYSYCQMHGTRCFKCGGSGKTLTKRGAAAQAFLRLIRSKPASEVAVGDKFMDTGIPGFIAAKWVTVQAIEADPTSPENVMLVTDGGSFQNARSTMVRIAQTAEQKAETLRRALAYQATLTQAGTVRKSLAKAVAK